MQITPATAIPPIETQAQRTAQAAVQQITATPKVFTPAPPLRPNIQDFVDIDRTLLALRS